MKKEMNKVEELELKELKEYINNTTRLRERLQVYLDELQKSPMVDTIFALLLESKKKAMETCKREEVIREIDKEEIDKVIKDLEKIPNSKEEFLKTVEDNLIDEIFSISKEAGIEVINEEFIGDFLDSRTENIQVYLSRVLFNVRMQYELMVIICDIA